MNKDQVKTTAVKSLTKKLIGSISIEDIKDVFSALIYKLQLTDVPPKKHFLILFSKKRYPFTFTLRKAISVMENLSVDIQLGSTMARISYQTKPKLELELVQLFFSAKLLHSPFDKTLNKVSDLNTILQPTPKGVAILHWYCQRIGVNQMNDFKLPEILNSNFNSMKLITFERDSRSNAIIHNEYWDKLLFKRIMGAKMNIWSFDSGPDPIKNYGTYFLTINKKEEEDLAKNIINPSSVLEDEVEFFKYLKQRQNESETDSKPYNNALDDDYPDPKPKNETFSCNSPFYHRFFTNPDSDSHIQYYTSKIGLRFFKSKTFTKNNESFIISACFSGKAIVQYLLDCTDIMHKKEAIKIANHFINYDLMNCCSLENTLNEFVPTREALYVLTESAYELLEWPNREIEDYAKKPKNAFLNFSSQNSHDKYVNIKNHFFNGSVDRNMGDLDINSAYSIATELNADNFGLPAQVDLDETTKSSSIYDDITLETVLKDPGLKHLLRQFMIDNLCVENLDAYDDILGFQSRFFVLKKLLSLKDRAKERYLRKIEVGNLKQDISNAQKVLITFRAAINRLCESSLIKVYNIYAMYLSENAPNELNINSTLKLSFEKFINDKNSLEIVRSSTCGVFENDIYGDGHFHYENGPKSSSEGDTEERYCQKQEVEKEPEDKKEERKKEKEKNKKEEEKQEAKGNSAFSLTLNLKSNNSLPLELASSSPTSVSLGPTLHFLNEVDCYYNQIKLTVLKIMETDSLNKFINSGLLNQSSITLHKFK